MSWKYYNHAMIPTTPPHAPADTVPLLDGSVWKLCPGKRPLLARWTTDFDCGRETAWWYVIRDGAYDPMELKAKRRYEITKGRKYFAIRVIEPTAWAEELYRVQKAAFASYPAKYRPSLDREAFLRSCGKWQGVCLGVFLREEPQSLCGYSLLTPQDRCIHYYVHRVDPAFESSGVNAALVDGALTHFSQELLAGAYLCDGQRNISHETAFQEYLEKYFGFRKAYCRLQLAYPPGIRYLVPLLYPFRRLLARLEGLPLLHSINGVLKMEAIKRQKA